ncbi:hypothetical protein [Clostridium butyricum]|uniref:hypothetical protein n=1 Tax=Clostridium butyricum TaxID=1492 RepID=UPI0024B98C3A|nr:hypothetical protein [Clostridium butyricum]
MGNETHPIISVYGNAELRDFPIILVVGREPNTSSKFVNTVGNYDFDKAPRCGFWNISYGIIGEIINETWNCKELKDKFRKQGNSFIAYTDLSPEPIEDLVPGNLKNKKRKDINLVHYEKHISNILSHENLINRVELIIFSGLDKNNVQFEALDILKKALIDKNKIFIEVPFFYGSNKNKIKMKINNEYDNEKEIIRDIYQKWENSL